MDQKNDLVSEPHIVIVGGGFAGLYTARGLKDRPVRVTVVDRCNYHLFQPLLYQVATAALSPADIAVPIRSILRRQANTTVLLGEVKTIALSQRSITLEDGSRLSYDYLVLATGARHSYFGHDEWETLAPGLKSLEDALEIRRRVLLAFEAAERATDPVVQQALLTFIIIGGGPTGVELAGALAEITQYAMTRDFRSIDPTQARIILLEAGPRLLATFPEPLAHRAQADLEDLGVEVKTKTPVSAINPGGVICAGNRIATHTVLWAAGVTASPLARTLNVPLDRAGRVLVEPHLTLKEYPEVFVIGDLAAAVDPATDLPLPGVATVAIQEGQATAANIWRACTDQPYEPFVYKDRGSMATIGRGRAIALIRRKQLQGFVAWIIWLLIHIYFLIGFENRLLVLIQWAWAYITLQRGARLITYETTHRQRIEKPSLN